MTLWFVQVRTGLVQPDVLLECFALTCCYRVCDPMRYQYRRDDHSRCWTQNISLVIVCDYWIQSPSSPPTASTATDDPTSNLRRAGMIKDDDRASMRLNEESLTGYKCHKGRRVNVDSCHLDWRWRRCQPSESEMPGVDEEA